jgi:hypothetical protein
MRAGTHTYYEPDATEFWCAGTHMGRGQVWLSIGRALDRELTLVLAPAHIPMLLDTVSKLRQLEVALTEEAEQIRQAQEDAKAAQQEDAA